MAHISLILQEKGSGVCKVMPDASVKDCLRKMKELSIGSVVVMQDNKVIGLFTERVAVRNVYINDLDLDATAVSQVMRTDIPFGQADMTIEEAMQVFTDRRIRQIPILGDGELIGIISIGDVTKWIIDQQQSELNSLASYIAGEYDK